MCRAIVSNVQTQAGLYVMGTVRATMMASVCARAVTLDQAVSLPRDAHRVQTAYLGAATMALAQKILGRVRVHK